MTGNYKDVSGESACMPDHAQPVQKVGMYWCVENAIVGEAVTVDEAEPYTNTGRD